MEIVGIIFVQTIRFFPDSNDMFFPWETIW